MIKKFAAIAPFAIVIALIFRSQIETKIEAIDKTSTPGDSRLCRVKPGSIYDGDTLRVICDREELRIRLCGIDAPEKAQAGGIESRDHLRSLVARGGGEIIVMPVESDRYGRTVAELFVPIGEEIHLNTQMILDGYAWHYAQYSKNCPNFFAIEEAEAIAKSNGNYIQGQPPWEYRKTGKSQ
ncbi:MAG: thermonuclease family protein [Limnospira sp.]